MYHVILSYMVELISYTTEYVAEINIFMTIHGLPRMKLIRMKCYKIIL
jgi:hypothetical protein